MIWYLNLMEELEVSKDSTGQEDPRDAVGASYCKLDVMGVAFLNADRPLHRAAQSARGRYADIESRHVFGFRPFVSVWIRRIPRPHQRLSGPTVAPLQEHTWQGAVGLHVSSVRADLLRRDLHYCLGDVSLRWGDRIRWGIEGERKCGLTGR
jgi:hypothetical protein